jgi:hypothetical protein
MTKYGLFIYLACALLMPVMPAFSQVEADVSVNQSQRVNVVFVFENTDELYIAEISQAGWENIVLARQFRGSQATFTYQNGALNTVFVSQLKGVNNYAQVIQQNFLEPSERVNVTRYSRTAYDRTFLADFVSGDISISIFGPSARSARLGRGH